jgi:eukaryotic-like serine/threonine-protein kinase
MTTVGEQFPIAFGRYQLISRLAVGGMAEVFLAESAGEHGFAKRVVIKRLLPQLVSEAGYQAMFIDEAKLTARLVHPKIAQTFELGKVGDQLFIAMELIDGADVLAMLREYAQRRRRVEPHIAAWICHEVLDALDYAHNAIGEDGEPLGVVHRDISPSNILMSLRGDVKLVDFGIARQKDPSRSHQTKSGTLKGKYGYMSPEQVVELPLDQRSDVFSVGVVLAELLTGRRLFAAANELDVLLMVRDAKLGRFDKYGSDIHPGLQEIVRRGLKKNLDERWQSAGQFRDAIGEWFFEQRIRMTPKVIADAVVEIRQFVEKAEEAQKLQDAAAKLAAAQAQANVHAAAEINDAITSVGNIGATDRPAPRLNTAQPVASVPPPSNTSSSPAIGRAQTRLPPPPAALPVDGRAPTVQVPSRQHTAMRTSGESPAVPMKPPSTPVENLSAKSTNPPPVDLVKPAPSGAKGSGNIDVSATNVGRAKSLQLTDLDLSFAAKSAANLDSLVLPDSALHEMAASGSDAAVARLPGLTAASNAIAPQAPDPAMRDFDDLTIEPGRRMDIKLPTAEEVSRKKPPTPPALADIADSPEDSGDFATTPAMRVLFRLMVARATGLLVVAIGGIKKEIYIRDGQPEYVSSNVASELFGNYLVSKGVLSDGELAMALAMVPHYGGKLGDTLVGLGLLKPLEVFRHLTRQVRSKIVDVCTWNKGQFGWYLGRENPREAFPLDFNAFEILGAGAMAMTDDVAEAWFARHGNLRLEQSRARRVGPERFEVKGLVDAFAKLDSKTSVADLVELQADRGERLRMIRLLYLLDSCELARAC